MMQLQRSSIWKHGFLLQIHTESWSHVPIAQITSQGEWRSDMARKRAMNRQSNMFTCNSTVTATERTLCCILENYQKENDVEIPEVLRGYMDGKDFIPFQTNPSTEAKGKQMQFSISNLQQIRNCNFIFFRSSDTHFSWTCVFFQISSSDFVPKQ